MKNTHTQKKNLKNPLFCELYFLLRKCGENGIGHKKWQENRHLHRLPHECNNSRAHTCFLDSSVGKESACNVGDPSLIPGLGRSSGEGKGYPLQYSWSSLVAQLVKNLPAMRKTWAQSLGWEDLWRRERLPTPVFLPGEFQGLYSPLGHKELDTTEQLSLHMHHILAGNH